jgi:hypothetical protein
MRRAIVLSVYPVVLLWAASAVADSPKLKGAYGFTGTGACLVAPGNTGIPAGLAGFDSMTLRPLDPGQSFSSSFAVEGIRTFNGDGTGTVKGTSVGITVRPTPGPPPAIPAFPPSAEADTFQYQFTYTVNGDGSWTSDAVPGTFSGAITSGPRTGQTFTLTSFPTVSGLSSKNGRTLIAVVDPLMSGAFVPTVETITFSNGDSWQRICHRSRVLIDLSNGDD